MRRLTGKLKTGVAMLEGAVVMAQAKAKGTPEKERSAVVALAVQLAAQGYAVTLQFRPDKEVSLKLKTLQSSA